MSFLGLFKKKKHSSEGIKIVVTENSVSKAGEGYNRLRDNVLFMNADGNTKVIQVESALAHEGKTTIVCNLAVSLGYTDKKICIVDLDFRRPRSHRIFNLKKENGIAEYMMGTLEKEDIIKHTKYKNVDMVTRGAEVYNPSLILVSEKFKKLIAFLREEYDFVLLDCAPILQVSDYINISEVSDGVIFVVAYAKTTKAQIMDAVKELRKNDIQILGSVFNMYDRRRDSYYGYKRYYGYVKYNDGAYAEPIGNVISEEDTSQEQSE